MKLLENNSFKFVLIITFVLGVLLIVFIIISGAQNPKITLIETRPVDRILSVGKDIIFESNNTIYKVPNNTEKAAEQVVVESTTYIEPSSSKNKVYYTKGNLVNDKSYIYDVTSNSIIDFGRFDSFFWQSDNPLFVKYDNLQNSDIYDEKGKLLYSNLPYSNFNSFANLILGDVVTTNPENEGYKWEVVSPKNNAAKEIKVNNYKEETEPWVSGRYMLYENSKNGLGIINDKGDISEIQISIPQEYISVGPQDDQYFIGFDGNNMVISSINLANGKVTELSRISKERLINIANVDSAKTQQVVFWEGTVYLLIDNKMVGIKL